MLLMSYVEIGCHKRGEDPGMTTISWTPDGRALIIRDHNEFANSILPLIFGTKGRFASFTRKLYRWGFRQKVTKVKKGGPPISRGQTPGVKIFFHKFFQRDNKKLLGGLKIIPADTTGKSMSPATQAHKRRETPDLGISSVTISPEQNALTDLLTARRPIPQAFFDQSRGVTDFEMNISSLTNRLIGQPSLTTSAALALLARRQAMMMMPIAPLPYFGTTSESNLFQQELTLQLMKRKRIHDLVQGAWQSLPIVTEFDQKQFARPNPFWAAYSP